MCWSKEVSIVTGATASILSLYLLYIGKGNDIPVALVSLAVALMQFAEAFMWEGVNTDSQSKMTLGSQLGLIALYLQPLVLGVGIAWTRNWKTEGILFGGLWSILALGTLPSLLSKKWIIKSGTCGHLQWSFLEPMLRSSFAPFYWIVMLGGWLLFKPFSEGLRYTLLAIGTLVVTWLFYPGEWGSLWCFLANALPLGRLLV